MEFLTLILDTIYCYLILDERCCPFMLLCNTSSDHLKTHIKQPNGCTRAEIGVIDPIDNNYLPNFIDFVTFVSNMTNFLSKITSTVSGPTSTMTGPTSTVSGHE